MKKFKKFVACLGLATIGLAAVGCSSDAKAEQNAATESNADGGAVSKDDVNKDEVIARVGDATIKLGELKMELSYVEQILAMQYGENFLENEEAKKLYDQQKELVVNYLVETQVLVQHAKDLGIEITDERIDEELKVAEENFGSKEAFDEALKQQNMTLDEFKTYLKQSFTVGEVVTAITKDVTVSDDEVKKYYDDNIAQYTVSPGAKMAHILVPTEEEAAKIKKEYEGGKSFEELAKQYGTDGTKDLGGDLGFISYDSTNYDQDFLAGAKALKEGEVSAPVKTQFGYHLIKVTDVQSEAKVTPLEEVKDKVNAAVKEQKDYEVFSTYLKDIKEKADIEIFKDKF
ncbi:MAG: peptidyl-prolyl cis-trans isomerase [Cellulosilyticaceae bacterium]